VFDNELMKSASILRNKMKGKSKYHKVG